MSKIFWLTGQGPKSNRFDIRHPIASFYYTHHYTQSKLLAGLRRFELRNENLFKRGIFTRPNQKDWTPNQKKYNIPDNNNHHIFSSFSQKFSFESIKNVFNSFFKVESVKEKDIKKTSAKLKSEQEKDERKIPKNETLLPKACEELYQEAMELLKSSNFSKDQSNKIKLLRESLLFHHAASLKGRDRNDLLQKVVDNLVYLNQQSEKARQESWQQRNSSQQENKEELEKLLQKMQEAETSRRAQIDKLEEIIKRQDASSNSRLALGVAYSSILSLLFAVLVFLYQQNHDSEKEKEQKMNQAEKARIKAEELAKKIEKLQLKYGGLINQKLAIEDSIKNLENSKAELSKMKSAFFSNTTLELGIKQLEAKIGQENIQLQYVLSEIKKLELYVTKQQELEEEQNKQNQPQTTVVNPERVENEDDNKNSFSRPNSPF